MHPDPQQDVVDKQRVSLVGMAEGRPQEAPQAGNRDVVDTRAGLIAQIANSRRIGLVSDRVQRRTRQGHTFESCRARQCLFVLQDDVPPAQLV
jgi:hypothetical protein